MPTVGEFLIDRLSRAGVRHAFGVPGDYVLNLYSQIERSPAIEMIGTTSEAGAGFAADAYARANGIGCVVVTYCVGGFSILNPIGGARAEKSPVVVISGSPGMRERNDDMLLHHTVGEFSSQAEVFKRVTVAQAILSDPNTAAFEIDRVLDACLREKGPVYIEVPRDIVDRPVKYDLDLGSPPQPTSDEGALAEVLGAVEGYLNSSRNPVILAGVEMARYGMGERLRQFAERVGLPVATTILGKSVFSERHPLSLGVYAGRLSRTEVRKTVDESDCVLMLGVMQTDVNLGFLPLKVGNHQRLVLATSEGVQVKHAHYDRVLFGDFVEALFSSANLRTRSAGVWNTRTIPTGFCAKPDTRVSVSRLFEKIDSVLTSKMAILADTGDSLFGASDLNVHDANLFFGSAFYTSMGFAVPGCLGVTAANPEVRPLVIVGDGAFQMTGMEVSTLVRRRSNAIVLVLNNQGYATERLLMDGPFNDIQEWGFHHIPQVIGGGKGYLVETEEQLDAALSAALADKGVSILNVRVDKKNYSPALDRFASRLKGRMTAK
jgi:indolepyruvate decarboxylase